MSDGRADMHKSQISNRSIIAQRAAANGRNGRHSSVAVLAPSTVIGATGPVRRTTAVKMTGAQRNSEGRRSEWSMSQNNRDGRDARWSQTVRSQDV